MSVETLGLDCLCVQLCDSLDTLDQIMIEKNVINVFETIKVSAMKDSKHF